MKPRLLCLLLGLSLLAAACKPADKTPAVPDAPQPPVALPADADEPGELVKPAVDSIIDIARGGDCAALAPWLVLRGSKTDSDWKRRIDYAAPAERVTADKQCAELQVLVQGLVAHDFLGFSSEKESEGEWLIWEVDFHYTDGSREQHTLAFLSVGGDYLLGEVN